MTGTLPLDGMRVVELSSFVATPLGGMTLAQLGADVIRVDQVGGGPDIDRWPLAASGRSLYWAGLNKGKRSVAADLRSPEGRAVVAALAAESGVVLTNAPPRPGLAYDELKAFALVSTPTTVSSSSARAMRAIAWARSEPCTMSFASSGS